MGILNRIVNILTLLVAVVIVCLSVMLYIKRAQLKDRGDKMADTIRKVAIALDKGSETRYQDVLHVDKSDALMEKSMHLAYYNHPKRVGEMPGANLDRVLEPFKKQAKDIIEQRDSLADTLKTIAKDLELPEAEVAYAKDKFQNCDSFGPKTDELADCARKVDIRNDELIDGVSRIAETVGNKLPADYKERNKKLEGYAEPLEKIADKALEMKERGDEYANNIAEICAIWGLTVPTADAIKGDDYMTAVPKAEAGIREFKNKFDQARKDVAKLEQDLKDAKSELEQQQKRQERLVAEDSELLKMIRDYQRQIRGAETSEATNADSAAGDDAARAALVKELKGKILHYYPQYGLVIVDLGKNSKIRNIAAPLPENALLYVSRGGKFISKVKVFQINNAASLASVVPGVQGDNIREGDDVLIAPPMKAPMDVAMAIKTTAPKKTGKAKSNEDDIDLDDKKDAKAEKEGDDDDDDAKAKKEGDDDDDDAKAKKEGDDDDDDAKAEKKDAKAKKEGDDDDDDDSGAKAEKKDAKAEKEGDDDDDDAKAAKKDDKAEKKDAKAEKEGDDDDDDTGAKAVKKDDKAAKGSAVAGEKKAAAAAADTGKAAPAKNGPGDKGKKSEGDFEW